MTDITYGIVSGSGGRWGADKRHAVKPGTTHKLRYGHSAEAQCGQIVTPFPTSSRGFEVGDTNNCKRCEKAVIKADRADHERELRGIRSLKGRI